MKNKFIAAVTFLTLSATSVLAGNADTSFLTEVAPVETRDWSGLYAGAAIGLSFGSVDVTDVDSAGSDRFVFQDIETSGSATALIAGYNLQSGNIVYGIEADYTFGGPSGGSAFDTVDLDETLEWETNWSYSIRGRVGIASNDWLFFGTAGFANSNVNFGYLNMDDAGTIIEGDSRETRTVGGWIAGLGAERAIGENLIVRGEVLFTELGYQELDAASPDSTVGYAAGSTEIRAAAIWSF